MAINSYGYAGTVAPGAAVSEWNYGLGSRYGVYYWTSLTPTMVTGGTRQVSIGAGRCYGGGVTDSLTTAQTVSLAAGMAGHYALIVIRRTWQTTNATTVTYVDAGTALPAGLTDITRSTDPGTVDDQPICLVYLPTTSTVPQLVYDLRMVGTGGRYFMADGIKSAWISFTTGGTSVRCGSVTYHQRPTADGAYWEPDPYIITAGPSKGNGLNLAGASHWGTASVLDSVGVRSPTTGAHQLRLQASRGGSDMTFTSGTGAVSDGDTVVATVNNTNFQPPYNLVAPGAYRTATGTTYGCTCTLSTSGQVTIIAGAPGTSVGKRTDGGWSLWVNFEWIA